MCIRDRYNADGIFASLADSNKLGDLLLNIAGFFYGKRNTLVGGKLDVYKRQLEGCVTLVIIAVVDALHIDLSAIHIIGECVFQKSELRPRY